MSVNNLPSFLKKKKLLDNANLPAAECRKYGNLFLEAGWLADALDFFIKGNISEGLQQLQALALDTGDAFLLERLLQVQGREAPELWQQVAAQATAPEKFTLAQWAEERAGKDVRYEADPAIREKLSRDRRVMTMPTMPEYYRILGISPKAGIAEIKRRFRLLALKFHPDRNPRNPKAAARFREVAEAYGAICHRRSRQPVLPKPVRSTKPH